MPMKKKNRVGSKLRNRKAEKLRKAQRQQQQDQPEQLAPAVCNSLLAQHEQLRQPEQIAQPEEPEQPPTAPSTSHVVQETEWFWELPFLDATPEDATLAEATSGLQDSENCSADEFYVILEDVYQYSPDKNEDYIVDALKPLFMEKLFSALPKEKIPSNWFVSKGTKYVHIVQMTDSDSPVIQKSIAIDDNRKLHICVHNKQVRASNINKVLALSDLQVSQSIDYAVSVILKIVKCLSISNVCCANVEDYCMMIYFEKIHPAVNTKGYVESDYQEVTTDGCKYSKTVRAHTCLLISNQYIRCSECSQLRKSMQLSKFKARLDAPAEKFESVKSIVPFGHLTSDQKTSRLHNFQELCAKQQQEIKQLKTKMASLLSEESLAKGSNEVICELVSEENGTKVSNPAKTRKRRRKSPVILRDEFFEDRFKDEGRTTEEIEVKVPDKALRPHFCKLCHTRFVSLESLEKHKLKTQQKCPTCSKAFCRESMLNEHVRIHTGERPFACTKCPKKFRLSCTLSIHKAVHTREKLFLCTKCGMSFNKKDLLKMHELIHTESKPYRCSFCSAEFRQSSHLKRHERSHTGERPFACSLCPKKYISRTDLNKHEQDHKETKPHACKFCNKGFYTSESLSYHERFHEVGRTDTTGRSTHVCSYCDKRFGSQSKLEDHVTIHTGERPYQCSHCPKTFRTKFLHHLHERTHTDERKFECSVCSKRFRLKEILVGHMRIHTGEKPFECIHCSYKFHTRSNWMRHVKRMHPS